MISGILQAVLFLREGVDCSHLIFISAQVLDQWMIAPFII